jgi:hypothetical protein
MISGALKQCALGLLGIRGLAQGRLQQDGCFACRAHHTLDKSNQHLATRNAHTIFILKLPCLSFFPYSFLRFQSSEY